MLQDYRGNGILDARNAWRRENAAKAGQPDTIGLMTSTAVAQKAELGSFPLRNRKHEIYARERSLCSSMEVAAQTAGYAPRCGKSSQLEKREDVRARIAFLTRDDAELIREKRRRIEERLNLAAYANLMDCVEVDQETGKLKLIDWRLVKDGPLAQVISEFAFDPKTGELTRFKREDALAAIAQLRDMHGLKAPDRVDARAAVAVELGSRLDRAIRRIKSDGSPTLVSSRSAPEPAKRSGKTMEL
jgi:hypothetical protein